MLYYIAQNNSVIVTSFAGGSWYNPGPQYGNSTFEAKPDSQFLAAAYNPDEAAKGSTIGVVVVFESTSAARDAISVQHGIADFTGSAPMVWQDVTENLTSTYPNAVFKSPFTLSTVDVGGDQPQVVGLFRDGKNDRGNYTQLASTFHGVNNTFTKYKSAIEDALTRFYTLDNADLPGVRDQDVLLANVYNATNINIDSTGPFGMVVNDTKLSMFRTQNVGPTTGPLTDFPFARLATTTPINSTIFYLYHQMNETHIAEESFDITVGTWAGTEYVEIGT